jgi:death-on-curing protein
VLKASDVDLYPRYLALAEGYLSEPEFAQWLCGQVETKTPGGIHERSVSYSG